MKKKSGAAHHDRATKSVNRVNHITSEGYYGQNPRLHLPTAGAPTAIEVLVQPSGRPWESLPVLRLQDPASGRVWQLSLQGVSHSQYLRVICAAGGVT